MMDITVTPSQGVQMINIDSAGDTSAIVKCAEVFETYKRKYSQEANADSRLFFLKHDTIPETEKQRQIQYDKTSCSRFTLDTLFHLSNVDAVPLLEAKRGGTIKITIRRGGIWV
jgi:hypothetical protein